MGIKQGGLMHNLGAVLSPTARKVAVIAIAIMLAACFAPGIGFAEQVSKLTQLEAELANAQRDYDNAVAEQADAESNYKQCKTAFQDVSGKLDAAKEDQASKKKALEATETKATAAEADREKAKAAVSQNASGIADAQDDYDQAQKEIDAAQIDVNTARDAVSAAEAKLSQAETGRDSAQADINAEVSDPKSNAGHEEWTLLGLFRHILKNTSESDAEHWDAQAAIDILTTGKNSTGHNYKQYEGPAPDGAKASTHASISSHVQKDSRADAISLDNVDASLDYIDKYNQYRAKENSAEGYSLATNVGMNCRLMAIAAVQLDVSYDYGTSGGHTQAYHVGENLSWGYSNPFDGWYTEEKAEWKNGSTSGVGHYMNIVDQLPKGTENPTAGTGFAVHKSAPTYGIAHGQVFHTTSGYAQYNPTVIYSTSEFRTRWFNPYYQAQIDAGMFGTAAETKAAHQEALAKAKAAVAAAQQEFNDAQAKLDKANAALTKATQARDAARKTLADLNSQTESLANDLNSKQTLAKSARADADKAAQGYNEASEKVAALEAEDGAYADAGKAYEEAEMLLEAANSNLEAAKERLSKLQAAIDTITDLPATITSDKDTAAVKAAREAYEALSKEQKALVGADTLEAIEDAESAVAQYNTDKANQDKANKVVALIKKLPTTVADDAAVNAIKTAREAYDALTPEQKAIVDSAGYNTTLKTAETSASKYEQKQQAAANTVKVGKIVKAGSGKARAKYKIVSATQVQYYRSSLAKSAKVISIPTKVTISGKSYTVTSIAAKALAKRAKLVKVTGGAKVKVIGAGAFSGCKSLKAFTVGPKVTKIGGKAFMGCKKLVKVTVKTKALKSIGKKAFKGTSAKI